MAIKSVSLLQYPNAGIVTSEVSETDNSVLVDKQHVKDYVAGNLMGLDDYNDSKSGGYKAGDYVKDNGFVYKALKDQTNVQPLSSSEYWEQTTFPILHKYSGEADENYVIAHNLETTNITVQVYYNTGTEESPVWTPVFINYVFGDASGNNTENNIKLDPNGVSGSYKVIIVAAK